MVLRLYRVVVFQGPDDGPDASWDAIFPEFPGCVSQGASSLEAIENGREALALHIEGMVAEGQVLPESSGPNLPLPAWVVEQEATMLRPLHALLTMEIPKKSVRLNITMDEALVERLDAGARRDGTTRSGYLAQAVREKLRRGREMA
jgi:predicted RNase H-like HicB family nuclease